jgi:hypothetical protein
MQLEEGTERTIQAVGAVADKASARRPGRRPKLTGSQQDEVVRLYSDAVISTAAIRERFGIQDATLYRLLRKRGVAPRGRGGTRGTRPRATSPSSTARRATANDDVKHTFSVRFRAERVVRGTSALDVLRELERLGATDVEEIRRE